MLRHDEPEVVISGGWGDEQGWDDGTDAWDSQRGGFDEQDNAGWEREYGVEPRRNPRDEWGDASRAPDPYAGRHAREDAGWEQRAPSSPGYGASADFRGSPQRGFDAREPRDPYAGAEYADYNGATGGYDDADDGHERKRKGWRGFFRRGE